MRFPSRVVLSIICGATVAACGHDPGKQAEQAQLALGSWRESLALVEQQYKRGDVPATYVEQMVRAGRRELEKLRADAERLDAADRKNIESAANSLEQRLSRLADSAGQPDAAKK